MLILFLINIFLAIVGVLLIVHGCRRIKYHAMYSVLGNSNGKSMIFGGIAMLCVAIALFVGLCMILG